MTFSQLRQSRLVVGNEYLNSELHWDFEQRLMLVNNLEIMVNHLWQVGIDQIFIDGSFVEEKASPHDIDGYFECDALDFVRRIQKELSLLDLDVWRWDGRKEDPDSGKLQLPMWHKYRVDLYPDIGQPSGILDEFGNPQQFPAAFRKARNHLPKGIVKIER